MRPKSRDKHIKSTKSTKQAKRHKRHLFILVATYAAVLNIFMVVALTVLKEKLFWLNHHPSQTIDI